MPNSKSAKKHMLTDAKRALQNKSRISEVRTTEKKFRMKVEEKDLKSAKELLGRVSSLYDKAAKFRTIKRNQADRKKSRLYRMYVKAGGN